MDVRSLMSNSSNDWPDYLQFLTDACAKFNFLDVFDKCESDIDRLTLLSTHKDVISLVKIWLQDVHSKKKVKSTLVSEKLRKEGNDYFCKKWNKEALEKYSESIFCTPHAEIEALSLGYANRSASLFHLCKYEDCICDIDLALQHKFPENRVYKLYLRKGESLVKLERPVEAIECFNKFSEFLELSVLSKSRKEELKNDVAQTLNSLKSSQPLSGESNTTDTEQPSLTNGEHNSIPFASASLKLEYTKEKGRFVTADCFIEEGSTLFVEKPFASVLIKDFSKSHCSHCYIAKSSLIPCKFCCYTAYCSVECGREAWKAYHQFECQIMDVLDKIGITHLSWRIAVVTGIDNLIGLKNSLTTVKHPSEIAGLDERGKYEAKSYLSIYHLVSHSKKRRTNDCLCQALTAILMLLSLENTKKTYDIDSIDPFQTSNGNQTSELLIPESNRYYIGSLLMHHIQQLICNAHAITDIVEVLQTERPTSGVMVTEQVSIATGIFASASLMNHSCNPNIISSFYKDCLIVRAMKPIEVGEEVFNCYGPQYKKMEVNERQKALLEQYFFQCKCKACEDEIGHKNDKTYYLENPMYEEALKLMNEDKFCAAVPKLESSLKKLELKLPNHHEYICTVQDKLAFCYTELGEYLNAYRVLRENLASVKIRFGAKSIEVAHELQKFSDLLFHILHDPQQLLDAEKPEELHRSILFEALDTLDEAAQIFSVFYGSWHRHTREMVKAKRRLMEIFPAESSMPSLK